MVVEGTYHLNASTLFPLPSVFRQSKQLIANIVAALQKNTTLRKLHLENIHMGEKESLLWSQFLSSHCCLQDLALHKVYFTRAAAEIFSKSLRQNVTINTFSLSSAYVPGTYYNSITSGILRDVLMSSYHTIEVIIINQSLPSFGCLDGLIHTLMRSPSVKFMELPGKKFFRCNVNDEIRFIKIDYADKLRNINSYSVIKFLYQEISASEYEIAKKAIMQIGAKNTKQNTLIFAQSPLEEKLTNSYLHDLENVSEYEHNYSDKEEASAYGLTKMLKNNLGSVIDIINSECNYSPLPIFLFLSSYGAIQTNFPARAI